MKLLDIQDKVNEIQNMINLLKNLNPEQARRINNDVNRLKNTLDSINEDFTYPVKE